MIRMTNIEKFFKSFKPAVVGTEFSYSRGQGWPDPCDLLQFVDLCPIEVDAAGRWTRGGYLGVRAKFDMRSKALYEAPTYAQNARKILQWMKRALRTPITQNGCGPSRPDPREPA